MGLYLQAREFEAEIMLKFVMALVCCNCGKNEWVTEMNVIDGSQSSYNLEAMKNYLCPVCNSSYWRLEVLVKERKRNGDGRLTNIYTQDDL